MQGPQELDGGLEGEIVELAFQFNVVLEDPVVELELL